MGKATGFLPLLLQRLQEEVEGHDRVPVPLLALRDGMCLTTQDF